MPELPEVESTVQYLQERVAGRTIVKGSVSWHRTVTPTPVTTFESSVARTRITSIFRRGKYIGMRLEGSTEAYLFTHLRMTGSLDVVPTSFALATHDRVSLDLDNGKSIRFNDTRKFGRMRLCKDPSEAIGHLGPEPLDPSFTPDDLFNRLQTRSTRIKPLLLDQSFIAGLGNIYVDEVLWKTKIHPVTTAKRISSDQARALHTAIQATLREAIEKLGTDFGDGVVYGGMYKPRVYGRTGKRCSRCSSPITRIVVAQRGTHICPTCQRKARKRR